MNVTKKQRKKAKRLAREWLGKPVLAKSASGKGVAVPERLLPYFLERQASIRALHDDVIRLQARADQLKAGLDSRMRPPPYDRWGFDPAASVFLAAGDAITEGIGIWPQ